MSNVKIRITAPLRRFTQGLDEVSVEAKSVGDALSMLCVRYPALDGRILGNDGELREFINIFVGKTNIRTLNCLLTTVAEGDLISVASPFSGG
jgi:adenylyltransferase/sulfurtransferase